MNKSNLSKIYKGLLLVSIKPCLIDSLLPIDYNIVIKNGISKKVTKNPITKKEHIIARLVNECYNKLSDRKDIENFVYNKQDSTINRAVYINERAKTIYYIAKGTDRKNINNKLYRDMVTNLMILLGNYRESSRFKTYNKYYTILKEKYPGYKIIATGHSLGGTQALYLSNLEKIPAIVFNCGILPTTEFKQLVKNKNVKLINQIGDPLSQIKELEPSNCILLGDPQRFCIDNHSMSNFIDKVHRKFTLKEKAIIAAAGIATTAGIAAIGYKIYKRNQNGAKKTKKVKEL